MWQSLGDFDFSILHTYPWYLQKVALKKLWKETKINQDHPVRNNCHSSYTFLGLTFFSHKWFQFTVFSSPFLGKNTGHMSEEKISHAPKPKGFFLPLEITPVKSSSAHVDCAPEYLKSNGNFALSDWFKGVPRDMFSWIAANNKQKIWPRSRRIDKMVASIE